MKISGKIVDVINCRIFEGEVVVKDGKIENIYPCKVDSDVYILPGFVNSHIHIESSMLVPSEFSKLAVKHGTVAVVTDPHEIANVLGVEGVNYMINDANKSPMKFYFGAPSCVPATNFETSGHVIGSDEIEKMLQRDDIHFLSEMMNFPGVIYNDKEVMSKINFAKKINKPIDGHAPGLHGEALKKYAEAGITTDHESSNKQEAEEKIKNGIKLQIREGSAAKNFESLYELIDKYPSEVMLCTDDSHPDDLFDGHINLLVKRGVQKGLDFFNVLQTATLNPVVHYNLDVGLLQKGDSADFIIVDNLTDFNIKKTFIRGEMVYGDRKVQFNVTKSKPINNFKRVKITVSDIEIQSKSDKIKVIKAFDGDLFTEKLILTPRVVYNKVVSDTDNDILKIVVVNRYNNSVPKVSFIRGFGFKKGAIAQSIAHDSHNIISVGTTDVDIVSAINSVIESRGGVVLHKDSVSDILPLPVAGLMTNEDASIIAEKYKKLNQAVKDLGGSFKNPFMTLSFMALLVIPEIKIGDKGLFELSKFELVNLFE